MIRLFIFLLLLFGLSVGLHLLMQYDGRIVLNWLGYRVTTQASTLAALLLLAFLIFLFLSSGLLGLVRAPRRFTKALRQSRERRGWRSLSLGLAAIAAGDIASAKKLAKAAKNLLPRQPLHPYLSAEIARLEGKRAEARRYYQSLLEHKETELLGLKALLHEEGGKHVAFAERAYRLRPNVAWTAPALLDTYKHHRKWADAELLVHQERKRHWLKRLLPYPLSVPERRERALLLLMRSREAEQMGRMEEAISLAAESYALLPGFVPVAAHYATLLARSQPAKSFTILRRAWKREPHRLIADTVISLSKNHISILKPAKKLAALHADHLENWRLMAFIYHYAGEPLKAREYLEKALTQSESVSLLELLEILELEQGGGDATLRAIRGRMKAAFPDPAWRCEACGHRQHLWELSCPNCQSCDPFAWHASRQALVAVH